MKSCWICVTSFVMRVMREPVEKASVCSKEKCMIRVKQALRMLFPKLCPAMFAHTPERMPKHPPAITRRIMRIPVLMTRWMSERPPFPIPRIPLSTITSIMRG